MPYLFNNTLSGWPAPPPLPGMGSATPFHILIDQDQWIADGILSGGVLQPLNLHEYCEQLANKAYGAFGGVTIFVTELDQPPQGLGRVAASGAINPLDAKTMIIFDTGLKVGKKSTLAHELGHVLGLAHAFPTASDVSELPQLHTLIPSAQQLVITQQAVLTTQQHNAAVPPTLAQRVKIDEATRRLKSYQDRLLFLKTMLTIAQNNPTKFTIFQTENMMDYDPGQTVDQRRSYWRWQWLRMQADVVAYYGTKRAAI